MTLLVSRSLGCCRGGWDGDQGGRVLFACPGYWMSGLLLRFPPRGELLCNLLAQLAYAALLGVEEDGRAASLIEVSRSMRDGISGLPCLRM